MKLISWNVNGIRAVHKKGFLSFLEAEQPDVLGLQETKISAEQLLPALVAPLGYTSVFAHAQRKGYSGTALFFKPGVTPLQTGIGMGPHSPGNGLQDCERFDAEGRITWAEFDAFWLYTVYFPNGKKDALRLQYKLDFYEAFWQMIETQRKVSGKPVIFCGDVNTAHQPIDLARPKENEKVSGFLPIERAWLDKITDAGYIDTLRVFHPEVPALYTWWDQLTRARDRNVGWRIDYFFTSPDARPLLKDANTLPMVMGSDHCPISLTLALGS
ncbi:MAG: exodeoxyribonuclease III [Vampirovibrionales bacterium]|nr:exodeoxyribonuclease III [Vampirovibrionales bacterium]